MDSSPPNDQASGSQAAAKPSIDSLRTVEFRTTLRGYHMDDVDEYLERVAVEAEALQEHVRLASDRVKHASERATSLEQQLEQARRANQAQQAQHAQSTQQGAATTEHAEVTDDALQRTLLLAQKFVDQTRSEAEREANELVSESEARARNIVADAEEHVRVMTEDAERSLREEVKRLDSRRAELVADVETIARHLEAERTRIRKALTEMLTWVDEHVQPPKSGGSHLAGPAGPADQSQAKVRERVEPPASIRERESRDESADSAASIRRPAEPDPAGYLTAEGDAAKREAAGREAVGREAVGSDADKRGAAKRVDSILTGLPTEQIPATSSKDSELDDLEVPEEEFAARPSGPRGDQPPRGSDRSASSHQRQMFGSGREPRQAGSSVIR